MIDDNTCIINDTWRIVGPDGSILIEEKKNTSLPDFVSMYCGATYDDVIKGKSIPTSTQLLSFQVIYDYYIYAYTRNYIEEHPSASTMEVLVEFLRARQHIPKQLLGYKDDFSICVADERFYPILLLFDYKEISYQEFQLRSSTFANECLLTLRFFPRNNSDPDTSSDKVKVQSVGFGERQPGAEYEEWVNSEFFLDSVWIVPTAGLAINPRTILEI